MPESRKFLTTAALVASALVILIVAFQIYRAATSSHAHDALLGTPFVPERDAPAVSLVDQHGAATPLIDPRAAATFVFFGYTHCKDTCPLALAILAKAYRALPDASGVRVELVTVDPAHDDPAALRRYVAQFDPHFVGLTARKAELEPVWTAFNVVVDARTNDVLHGEAIYLVDRAGKIVTLYPPDVAPADLAHDARIVAGV
jgi:protein SCO1/2